jgi:dihydrofolate synthase/folylpolyglutamate synthase
VTYERVLAALERLEHFGIRLGLENIRAVCAELGHPERAYRVVHVAGTNGKGTTAATLAALAQAHGARTGLYTSPHLVDFRERIRIDGRSIAPDETAAGWERIAPFIEERGMTYFEATTLLAFDRFAEAGVELAVVEVGLGGRLDATNVVAPELAVVTGVARDHERELGSELGGIAREKAGIFKAGVPALVGDPEPHEVASALAAAAAEAGAPLAHLDDEARWTLRGVEPGRTRFDYASSDGLFEDLALPLTGAHFGADAALGLRAWERIARGSPVAGPAVRTALAGLGLGGRGEWRIVDGVPHLLDVAHNPPGCERLADTVAALGQGRAALVFGVLADKDWEAMLDALSPVAAHAWLCDLATAGSRRLAREVAAEGIARRGIAWAESVEQALAAARAAVAAGEAGFVLVAGSFHTVGEALVALGLAVPGEPYEGTPRAASPEGGAVLASAGAR